MNPLLAKDILFPTQRKLVNALLDDNNSRRWALAPKPEATKYLRAVMAQFVATGTMMGGKGLVVCPSANLHFFWSGGWKGDCLSAAQFMNAPIPDSERIDVAAFDLCEGSDKFCAQLDDFLTKGNAERCVIWISETSRVELGQVLAKHRFVVLDIN